MLCKKPTLGFGCGQCIPCRINFRNIWSHRIMLEAEGYPLNAFLTLTTEKQFVRTTPNGLNTLDPVYLKNFWKRLRKKLPSATLRYYAVGEYGHDGDGYIDASLTQWNPHYHAALFNFGCMGKIQRLETGARCYCHNCELVHSTWKRGNITLDELNPTTANYIAGYVVKKMTAQDDPRLNRRQPEFSRMSQGIARAFVPAFRDTLLSTFGHLAFQLGDIPTSVSRGGSNKPLGRYLRSKTRQAIDLYKINPETGEVTYGTPLHTLDALYEQENKDLFPLQAAVLANPLDAEARLNYKIALDYKQEVITQKITNLETKYNLHQSKKGKRL